MKTFNPFSAPACKKKNPGWEECERAFKQYIFWSCNKYYFNSVHFCENLVTYYCEKEKEKAKGSLISHFHWLFSNDIMAVKGLN